VTALLNSNVLIAPVVAEHVHHNAAAEWLSAFDAESATCPSTQGSLVRFLLRTGQSAAAARDVVSAVESANTTSSGPTVSLSLMWRLGAWPRRP
jgi:predicted nucleic acid-binding protein